MPEDASQDFGASLRQARERCGVSLRQIATNTKISVQALEALERNDVSRLPGGIFTRAFVRAYAREVGLDPEESVRLFTARFPDEAVEGPPAYDANPEKIVVDEAVPAARTLRALWWALPIVLVIAYFGFAGRLPWWHDEAASQSARGEQPAEPGAPAATAPVMTTPLAPPPADRAAQPAQPEGTSIAAPTPAAAAGAPTAPPAAATDDRSGPPPAGTRVETTPAPRVLPAAAPDQASPGGAPAEENFKLTLTSREMCWATVRVNGTIVFSGVMNAGDRQDLTVHGRVSLTVGNGAAVALAINDQPTSPLGEAGQVVTRIITAQNLKTFLVPR